MEVPSPESQRIFSSGLFEGKVAIVTGGGSGIGLATAQELARLGARIAICGRTEEKLTSGSEAIAAFSTPDQVMAMACDIRDSEMVDAFVAAVVEKFGTVDLLVNNAGGQFPSAAQNISPNGFAAVVNNNLNGTFNMTRAVANAAMIGKGGGQIVNVIANIYRGFPGMAHTGAARAGVENLTMTLAVEWAKHDIQVNAVAPGVIRSSGTKRYPPALLEHAEKTCPAKRLGSVEEVAASILFLLSPGAQYITGTTLRIDGAHSLSGDLFPH